MNDGLEYFERRIVTEVRDRALDLAVRVLANSHSPFSIARLSQDGDFDAAAERFAPMLAWLVDATVERFLFEIDQLVTMKRVRIDLLADDAAASPRAVDGSVLVYELLEDWIAAHSSLPTVAAIRDRFDQARLDA